MPQVSQRQAGVLVVLLVVLYLTTAFVPMMHSHQNSIDENSCTVCYYFVNHHFQDLPGTVSVDNTVSFQVFDVSQNVTNPSIIVLLHDPSRAPPLFQPV